MDAKSVDRLRQLEVEVASASAILSSLPDPLIILDRRARIVRANVATEELLGQGIMGRRLGDALADRVVLEVVETVLEDQISRVVEFSMPGRFERHFSARVAPLPSVAEDDSAAILSLHEMTAVKRAEQMRADFVANASHELRTPLSSLLGFIETLQGPAKDDINAQRNFLAIMHEQAARMSRLIHDLLSLSRIEMDEHRPPTEKTEIGPILNSIVGTLEVQAGEKNMQLVCDLTPLPAVAGEADEIAQVMQNLIDNAIKYGDANSTVRIEGRLLRSSAWSAKRWSDPAVAIAVVDQGEGIAEEHLGRLTERFYRVDTARSRELGGTGLGLAIVKHILKRHRGELMIDSEVGKGSTFTVLLPIASDLAQAVSDMEAVD